jgi:PAS domain S-box-containing protein
MIGAADILRASILIVDDQPANVSLLEQMLHDAGYTAVSSTTDPFAVCGLHAANRYCLILLDLQMPGMDGFQVMEGLKEIEGGNDLPVLVITAQPGHKLRALRAGAKEFVSKPFDLAEVLVRVHNMLEVRLLQLSATLRNLTRLENSQRIAGIGDWELEPGGNRLVWSDEMYRILGIAPGAQPETAALERLVHPDDLALFREEMQRSAGEEPHRVEFEHRIIRPSGEVRHLHQIVVAKLDEAGRVALESGTIQDITERKRLEEHFLQAQKMEALGQFSSGVAHDFNNILMAIGGYTELAQMSLTGNPTVREFLGSVLQAAHRAGDIVRQILTFSRQHPQERRFIRMQPIVAETMELLRVTIPSSIEFEVDAAPDAPTVFADPNQVHQVLMNLGTNASHAMRDLDGVLRVGLERLVVGAASQPARAGVKPGVYAHLSVSDTGCGMTDATLRRIFEPFFTTKPVGEGTGLGMAVVKAIMDGHDGTVAVESKPWKGTSVHLYFPERSGAVVAPEVEDGPVPRGGGERILVVDDEEALARFVQTTLTTLGYEVEARTRPEEALALVTSDPTRYALVVTDQTMPGMSGLQLSDRLRQVRPGLPILLMSGYAAPLTPVRLESAGVLRLLLKPCGIHSLGTAVHAALASQHTAGPAVMPDPSPVAVH